MSDTELKVLRYVCGADLEEGEDVMKYGEGGEVEGGGGGGGRRRRRRGGSEE